MISNNQFVQLDTEKHERQTFDCGEDELNTFLKRYANQNAKTNISRTFVLPRREPNENGKHPILAFFSLTMGTIDRNDLAPKIVKRFPRYPIPVFIIGQLAVDKSKQGKGAGKITLFAAYMQIWNLYTTLGIGSFVVVDCLNDFAEEFYRRQAFLDMGTYNERKRMYIPITEVFNTIKAAIKSDKNLAELTDTELEHLLAPIESPIAKQSTLRELLIGAQSSSEKK